MRVSSVACANVQNLYNQDTRGKVNRPIKPLGTTRLNADTVTFCGNGLVEVNGFEEGTQLYRAIGESEYQALIRGEMIFSSGHVTANPKGFYGVNWHSGFRTGEGNIYFVTFKKEGLPVVCSRDYWNDAKIGIGGYTIDNVVNIRKGTNIHGELVFARDFKAAQMHDRNEKLLDIKKNFKILARSNDEALRNEAWDSLLSYVREFPKITKDALEYLNPKSFQDLQNFVLMLCEVDKKSDIPKLKETIGNYIKIHKMPSNILAYLERHGENCDVPMLLSVADKFANDERMEVKALNIGKTLASISDGSDKTHHLVFRTLLDKNPNKLNVLAAYFAKFNEDGSKTNVYRKILKKALKTDKSEIDNLNYNMAIVRSADEIAKYGNHCDIKLLKKFVDEKNPKVCPSDSICKAIDTIAKRCSKLI